MVQSRFQVLVVEDDEELNSLECELLEVHGMRAVSAYTGQEALDRCEDLDVDAVLLDIMLPQKDGFETCRILRERIGNGLPIVMITALDAEDGYRRGVEAGADAYFLKPFDPDELIAKVRELLRRQNGSNGTVLDA